MKELWISLASKSPRKGDWVLVWNAKTKQPQVLKFGEYTWAGSGFNVSFTYGSHWMPYEGPIAAAETVGRKCPGCERVLAVEAFGKDTRRADRLMLKCKDCTNDYYKTSRARNAASKTSKWAAATLVRLNHQANQ